MSKNSQPIDIGLNAMELLDRRGFEYVGKLLLNETKFVATVKDDASDFYQEIASKYREKFEIYPALKGYHDSFSIHYLTDEEFMYASTVMGVRLLTVDDDILTKPIRFG
ncbi:hypothetical protein [Agrobacterium pusense]|uniref:hypothetical protein n=1 Tax=Agrobacterium pusense TaxID=648995 RepID=UPI0022B87470|nr:hypothetical protein [Agrobacterium pusense]MCZ7926169.1 hypothetical protein [Agrobacterium pusense]